MLLVVLSVAACGRERAAPVATAPAPTASGAQPGVCDGRICGPSGAFTVATFPTTAGVDFSAFPSNPRRPYEFAAGGRSWFVATTGDDAADGSPGQPLKSIERAVERAKRGDVIWVGDGTYTPADGIRLSTAGVKLAALNPLNVVIAPAPGAKVGIWAEADDVVVDGFRVQGFESYQVQFGRIDSTQKNVVLKHLATEGGEAGVSAVDFEANQPRVSGVLIYDVSISKTRVIGLNCGIGPCNNMRIEAVRVRDAGGTSENSGADGIAIERGDNILIFNVEVSGAEADGIDLKTTKTAIANAWVHDNTRNGVKLWKGGDIVNTLVYNTGADASLVLAEGGRYRILNSVVARHLKGQEGAYAGSAGYDVPEQSGRVEIVNSIFFRNSGAMWVSNRFELDVRYSIFFGAVNGEEIIWRDTTVGARAEPFDALYAKDGGCCDRMADPGFVAWEQGNWSPGPDSAARDSGTSVDTSPSFDLVGNPRVVGRAVDLGPIEAP